VLIRIVVAGVCVAVALVVAQVASRRKRQGPPVRDAASIPRQLDRADFARPEAPWLVAIFSSATCEGCAPMAAKVAVLESPEVSAVEVEYQRDRELHDRYAIDSVPLVVIADAEGVVHRSFLGANSATDLWAAIAELRS
jgi:hypothetical protein